MQIEIFEATEAERLYTYTQSSQIAAQTGCLGHLRADFDTDGNTFWSTWFDQRGDLKTDAFREQFDEIINEMRFGTDTGKLLSSRAAVAKFFFSHPNAVIGNDKHSAAFRFDHGDYAYLMRLNPYRGEYNLYLYVYVADHLDRHMKEAERGVRFIDPHYNELFRMPDGGVVRITHRDGKTSDRICRYIDDYHAEIGSNLYHICEFAERMEAMNAKVEPVTPCFPVRAKDFTNKGDEAR